MRIEYSGPITEDVLVAAATAWETAHPDVPLKMTLSIQGLREFFDLTSDSRTYHVGTNLDIPATPAEGIGFQHAYRGRIAMIRQAASLNPGEILVEAQA